MLPFDEENLRKIDRVLVRRHKVEAWVVATDETGKERMVTVSEYELHISLFAGRQQVEYGAAQQGRRARNGEFTTNQSGVRSTIKFLSAITGRNFLGNGLDTQTGVEIYQPSQVLSMPVREAEPSHSA